MNIIIRNSNKVFRKFFKSTTKQSTFLQIPQLIGQLNKNSNIFVVEISEKVPQMLNRSIWAGNPLQGASWLPVLLSYLPHKDFYLYIDYSKLNNNQTVAQRIDKYFEETFQQKYLGLCLGERNQIPCQYLHSIKTVFANNLLTKIRQCKNTLLIDVRNPKEINQKPVLNIPQNVVYQNIPLPDRLFPQKVKTVMSGINENTQIITMCAAGYRSTIAYTVLRQLFKNQFEKRQLFTCKSSFNQINEVFKSNKTNLNNY